MKQTHIRYLKKKRTFTRTGTAVPTYRNVHQCTWQRWGVLIVFSQYDNPINRIPFFYPALPPVPSQSKPHCKVFKTLPIQALCLIMQSDSPFFYTHISDLRPERGEHIDEFVSVRKERPALMQTNFFLENKPKTRMI